MKHSKWLPKWWKNPADYIWDFNKWFSREQGRDNAADAGKRSESGNEPADDKPDIKPGASSSGAKAETAD